MQKNFDLGPLGAELRAFQIFESLGYAQISSGNISAIKNDTRSYEVSTWRKWLVEIKSGEKFFLLPPQKKLDPRGGHSRHPGHIVPNFFGFLTLEKNFKLKSNPETVIFFLAIDHLDSVVALQKSKFWPFFAFFGVFWRFFVFFPILQPAIGFFPHFLPLQWIINHDHQNKSWLYATKMMEYRLKNTNFSKFHFFLRFLVFFHPMQPAIRLFSLFLPLQWIINHDHQNKSWLYATKMMEYRLKNTNFSKFHFFLRFLVFFHPMQPAIRLFSLFLPLQWIINHNHKKKAWLYATKKMK